MIHKNTLILAGAVSAILAGVAMADTPYIGVNFLGRNDGANGLNATDTAGLVPQANYNNITFGPNTDPSPSAAFSLVDASGGATAVTLVVAAADSWSSGSNHASTDNTLLNGIIKSNSAQSTSTYSFANVAAGTYNLIVYTTENGAGSSVDDQTNALNNTGVVQVADGITQTGAVTYVADTGATAGNYVELLNVSPDGGGNLVLSHHWDGGSDGTGVAGLQLTQVPEPASLTALLGGVGMLLGLRRRRS